MLNASKAVLAGFVVLISLASLALAVETSVDFDKEVDFTRFKAYAWKAGNAAPNPLVEDRIRKAIETQLVAKGLTKDADGKPDLYVSSHVRVDTDQSVTADTFGGWRFGSPNVYVTEIPVGTLMVDLTSVESGKLVWRGIARSTISDPKKSEKLINKAAAKMFKKYPPKPPKKS